VNASHYCSVAGEGPASTRPPNGRAAAGGAADGPSSDAGPADPADRELSVSQARLRFRDEGSGPAVLLIHGWTLDLQMWDPQVRALADSFRLIRLDRRGFGLSAGEPALARDVVDARALGAHLQLRSVAVVGMSQGARVAAQLAAAYPEWVCCVVFDGPPAGILDEAEPDEEEIPTSTYRALVRAGNMEAFRIAWSEHPLARLHTTHVPTRKLLERMLERYRGLDLRLPTSPPPPVPMRVGSIRQPALVISGELDLASRTRSADALCRALPSCRRAVVPAAGHLPNLDNPVFYNTLLREFLQQFAT
jgi:pimeloyl-ACP methyl ester carboxylesterase